mgnify:CR=1 FL=1
MNLIIDIGNTAIKFAVFKGKKMEKFAVGDAANFSDFIKDKKINKAIISAVAPSIEIEKILKKEKIKFIHLSSETKIPIENQYKTPKTLGDDRLANVVALSALYPNSNSLTIDCGTCIKFDSLTSSNEYKGGAISPGLRMRFEALTHFTDKLPLIEPSEIDFLIGDTSENSILSGVINGCKAEIDGVISQYHRIYENLTVILTGGDAHFFENELKNDIFVNSNLTLIGLNEILLHND